MKVSRDKALCRHDTLRMNTTTVARLREALGPYFPSFDAVIRRMREAHLLPFEQPGATASAALLSAARKRRLCCWL